MILALILCAIAPEIGVALFVAGPHPIAAGVLAVVAVLSILFVGDRYAETENTVH